MLKLKNNFVKDIGMKKITALLIYFCFISIFSNVYALSLGPEQRGFSLKSSNIDRLVALQEKYERLQELLVPEEFNFDEVIQLAQEINIFQIKFDIFFIFSEEKMNYQFFIEDGKAIYDLIGPIFLEKIKAYEEEAVVESDSEEELEYSKICGDLKKEEDDLEKLKIDLRNVQNKISNLEKKLGDFQKDLSRAEKGQRKIIRSKIVLVKKSLGETKRRKELLVQRRDKLEKSIKQKRINKKEQEQKIVLLELRKKEAVSQKQIPEYLKSWKKIFTAIEGFKQTKQSKQTKIKNLLRLLDTIEQKDKNNYKLICVYVYEFLVCYIRQEIEELVKDISLDEQCYLSNENKKIIKYFICCILVIRKKSEYLNIKTLNLLSITTVFSIRTFYACRVKIEIKDQIAFYDEMFKDFKFGKLIDFTLSMSGKSTKEIEYYAKKIQELKNTLEEKYGCVN